MVNSSRVPSVLRPRVHLIASQELSNLKESPQQNRQNPCNTPISFPRYQPPCPPRAANRSTANRKRYSGLCARLALSQLFIGCFGAGETASPNPDCRAVSSSESVSPLSGGTADETQIKCALSSFKLPEYAPTPVRPLFTSFTLIQPSQWAPYVFHQM